jgi:uncharacterized protein (DUF2267 family)
MTHLGHDNFISLVVREKSQVHPPKCRAESIIPRFATGHQRLKRDETGATLTAQISVLLATDYGQRKRTLTEPSSRFTCERADTQGSKHDQSSHDAKSVVEVLDAPIRTRRIERFLKSETKAGKERVNPSYALGIPSRCQPDAAKWRDWVRSQRLTVMVGIR